jgi:rRNA biogenesis protein RRP5
VDDNAGPQTAEDFERALISQPNSSMLWIQYMSYFLMSADVDAARKVGTRALRVINYREEDVSIVILLYKLLLS